MASEPNDLEREARERVAHRQERETRALAEFQRGECERDTERQNRAPAESLSKQANFETDKEKALAAHEKRWKEASDRLTPRPIPVLAYDMMGPPPARNLPQDHDEIRQRPAEAREQIVKDFDQRIAAHAAARAEMQQGFSRANEARDQAHGEARRDLADNQQQSFDRLVNQEIDRADQWKSSEFNRRSRDDDARDR